MPFAIYRGRANEVGRKLHADIAEKAPIGYQRESAAPLLHSALHVDRSGAWGGTVSEAESGQRIRREYGHFTPVIGNEPLANNAYGLLYAAESGRIRVDELEYPQRTGHV